MTSLDQAGILSSSDGCSSSTFLKSFESGLMLRRWPWRVAAFIGLFVAQGVWLTVQFDTTSLVQSPGNWRWFFRILPLLPQICVCLVASIPLLGVRRIRECAKVFAEAAEEHSSWPLWWSGQWIAFALLNIASEAIFRGNAINLPTGVTWATAWIAAAVACLACCLCAIAPPKFWWRFTLGHGRVLSTGLAMAICATGVGHLFQFLWAPLGNSTFRLVAWWLGFVYSNSIVSDAEHQLLGTEAFYVHIAPQCSGYEGIGLISVFTLVFFAVFRQTLRFPNAWLLLPIGILLNWICNSLRIAALIVIGTEYSANVALGGFHSQAGWILFNLVSLGLMAGALRSEFFTKTTTKAARRTTGAAVPYLVPFLVLTAVNMLIVALVDNAAALYPLTVVASLSALWYARAALRSLTWAWSPTAIFHAIGVYVVWTALAWVDSQARGIDPIVDSPGTTVGGVTWTIFRVFGAVVTVPIIEELAFRGFLLRRLAKEHFDSVDYRNVSLCALLVSSMAFGIVHELTLGAMIAGISYAWLARRSGNLAESIQAHAITNALIAVTVLTTGATWLW